MKPTPLVDHRREDLGHAGGEIEPVADTAAGEGVDAQPGEPGAPGRREVEPPRARPVGRLRLVAGHVAGRGQGDGHGPVAGLIGIQPEDGPAAGDVGAADPPAGWERGHAGQLSRGRDRLRGQDHGMAGAAERRMRADVFGGEERVAGHHPGEQETDQNRQGQGDPPQAPALQRDGLARRGQGTERAQQVARVLFHERAQLGRAGHPAGGGERLAEFGRGEVAQRLLVDPVGVGAHRENQHHVAEVDGLPPRRGPHLDEGHVDEQQLAVADHEVARLDVPVRDARVPELADQLKPLGDHLIADIGVADLDGAVEELGDDHVLALGGDLHDPVRPGRADPGVAQQAQRVVLVFGQPPHGLEGMLVFQRAVENGPRQLVPAVGAHVALGVQLGEDVLVRPSFDAQPQRRRAGR